MPSYLHQLAIRLAMGAAESPAPLRQRHADYVKAAQRPDGGFSGREGDSDLYYTSFAFRSLFMLGELNGDVAERGAEFLRSRLAGRENVVDFLSLIYAGLLLDTSAGIDVFADASPDWRDAVAGTLERLRRDDGGYAKAAVGRASSTYSSFLVASCLQFIDRPIPQPRRLIDFILAQRCESGGFHEIKVGKRAGTNPTAAAVALLKMLDSLDNDVTRDTVDFLADMQTEEGGLRANTRIPIADLLSTFTGVVTLQDLGGMAAIDLPAVRNYAVGLEERAGGFRGAAWDAEADMEYTFYGLGVRALLG